MRRSIVRLIVLIVTLGLTMSGMAFANPDPAPPSTTAAISGGIFKEVNDKFLSTTDFSDLESHVVFLQFDMPSGVLAQGFEIGGSADLFGMYVGAYLNSILQGMNGQLAGNASQITNIDKDFQIDGGGLITGSTEQRAVSLDYNLDAMNDFRALVGVGTMGVGLSVYQNASNGRGSYTPNHTFSADTNWNNITVGTTGATANTLSTFDAVGALVSVNSDARGPGTNNDQQLDFTASFGMPLPISDSMELAVGGDVLFGLRNNDRAASREQFTRVVGSGTALSYTPAQTIDGSDPVAIADLTSYTYSEAMEASSHMIIAPSLFAKVMMPLKEAMTATGGLNLGISLPLYSAKYDDNAGVQQKVSGLADSYYSINVTPVVNATDPTLIQTTTATTQVWDTEDNSTLTVDLDLSAGLEVVSTERFRFGVNYMPMITYTSSSTVYTGEEVRTTVVDNGDGVDGVGDSVVRDTKARSGYSSTTHGLTVSNRFNTAAQFFLIPDRLRVNLGAQVDNVMIDRTLAETITNGLATYTTSQAADTTDTAATTFVVTDYQFNTDVRAGTDDAQTTPVAGSSSLIYDAGLTFFFDESMFLDLRMDAGGGDIWDTTQWSLEMTILY